MKNSNGQSKADIPLIKSSNLFPVVGIGASAGGLDAFKKLLKAIPEDSGMAYVLVQHLDPKHESLLPELLQKVTKIPVIEITDDIKVQPNHIYVIPSNKIMVATDGVLLLAPRPAKSKTERNLPIDLFFASLAEVHQEHAIGVVLSGTASDGTQGLKAIKEHGGITFAQDEASAEYEGMPHSAILAGVVDFVLSPEEMPKKLLEVINKTILSDEELQNIPKEDEDVFKQILSLLRIRKGVDFTNYKQTTVRRRILRRMVVNKNEEPGDYLKFLRGNNPEQDLLYQDMLIPVTSFFRDKKVFEKLCVNVFPTIIKNKTPGEITRVWVAGCSTGQEVFSFAMCFKEFLGDNHEKIQIFGTDLSEPAITKARTGIYEKSELDAVSAERLKEYFTKNNGGYQINKSIRDMCVFAHHNFLKDPPFGKMDVITCRNVLIYMEPYLQKKALTTFHYALNPGGFLLLGKSETTGGVPDLFAAVEKIDKLYTRKDVPGRFMQVASQRSEQILNSAVEYSKNETIRTDFQKTADDILLSKYTPGGVVVNEAMDIVHFRGNTANYLEQAPGKPSHNLLVMAKSGLGFELRNILHKAKMDRVPVLKDNIPLSVNGSIRNISIEAVPLPKTLQPYYLVLFHDNNPTDTDGSVTGNRKKVSAKTKKEEKDIQIQLLEHELAQAREDMRSITEDQEASNEELQSANEELLSGSEELQSLNEELETSKEELQSTNEELTVLNHELIGLNEQVTDAKNYSESIVATLYQPLLVLDKHLRVKTANQAFYNTFKVHEEETEGVLIYDLGNRQWNIPELRTLLEEILPQKKHITNFEVTHNFLSIGERIILLSALELTREKKEEKLILLSIEDITERKEAAKKIEESEKRKAFLLKLSDAIRPLSNPVDIEAAVTKNALDFMDADWCHYCTIEGDKLSILHGAVRGDLTSATGVYSLSSFALFKVVLDLGRPFIVDDVRITDVFDEDLKLLCTQLQHISFINVPVIKNGKPVGMLSIVQSKPRKWTDSEVQLTIETAERTWAAVERAIGEEALRKSEEKYRTIFTSIDQGLVLCELVRNKKGKGIDYYMLEVNPTYEKQTGLSKEMVLGKTILQVFPTMDKSHIDTFAAVVDNQCPIVFEQYFDVNHRWHEVKVYPGEKDKFTVLFSDITERKQREERQAFLLTLSDALKTQNNAVTIQETAMLLLGDYMQVNRAFYTKALDDEETLVVGAGYYKDVSSLGGTLKFSDFDADMMKIYGSGNTLVVTDVESDDRFSEKAKAAYRIIEMRAVIAVPLVKDGKLKMLVVLHQSTLRKWTAAEIRLIEEVSHRTWDAAERATAEEALRQNEEKYRSLFNSIDQGYALCELVRNKEGKGIDYYMLEGNSNYEKQSGVSIEMMLGKSLLQVFPTVDKWWIETYAAVVDDQRPAIFEKYFEITHRWFEVNAYPCEKDGFAILFNDITERKQAEDKLKESENRFRTMADASPVLIWTLDAKGLSTYYNKTFLDFLGVLKDADISNWESIVHPDDVQLMYNILNAAIAEHSSYSLELRLLRADGQWRWVMAQGNASIGANNKFLGFVGSSVDITERKEAEEKIAFSEHRYHEMIYSSPSLLAILKGEDMIIEIANNAIIASWGKGKDIIGKSLFAVLPEIVVQGFDKLLLSVYKTGEPVHAFETPITLLRNGINELIYYNFIYQAQRNVNGEIDGVAVIANEVTPQALLNKKIKESEAFNSAVLESSPDCIKMMDEEGRLQFMNVNGLCILEIDDFSLVKNKHWWDLWDAKDKPMIKNAVKKAQGGERVQFQALSNTYKGTPKWWDIIIIPINVHDKTDGVHQLLSVSRDITEQKQQQLKEKELLARFQTLVVEAPVAICVLRGEDHVIEVINKEMYEMWDRTLEETLNKPALEVLPELLDQGFKTLLDNVYKTGERFVADEMPVNLKRNGKVENIFVQFVYEPLREADGSISGVMCLSHEITAQVMARKKIEESETKFRTLIEDAPVATCFFTGKEMRLEIANDKILAYWGRGKDIIGKTFADAIPELIGQPFLKILDDVFTTGKVHEGKNEVAQLDVNGVLGTYYFDYTFKPIRNDVGEVYGIMNMAIDVTEQVLSRKKIEASESYFRLMANMMPAKISNAGADGSFTYFNKNWLTFSGYTFEELRDFGYHKIMHPDETEEFKTRLHHAAATRTVLEMQMRFLNNEGQYKWHLNLASPVMDEDENIKMWIGVTTEIQHQKEQEERLENAVKQRTQQLREANEELNFQNEEKEKRSAELMVVNNELQSFNFISSHDLQEPLRKIQTFAKRILETEYAVLSDEGKHFFDRMNGAAIRMRTLIDDLLAYSHTNTGEHAFEKANLLTIVEEVKTDLSVIILHKNAVIETDIKSTALVNASQFRQVISNLVTNALKFSKADLPPHIKITSQMGQGAQFQTKNPGLPAGSLAAKKDYTHISFSDNGIGFDPEYKHKIFQLFQRLHSKEDYEGTGIGLAIVKKIIDNHNGCITATGVLGKGATFDIYIPV